MTWVDLEDRAPGGESRVFLAVADVLADAGCPDGAGELTHRVCEALEVLGRQQEDPALARADMEEWQRQAEQIAAAVRARKAAELVNGLGGQCDD